MLDADFLAGVDCHCNHRYLLLSALRRSRGPVLELGMGKGSTPQLHAWCADAGRYLQSWDSNPEWSGRYASLAGPRHRIDCCQGDWDRVSFAVPKVHGVRWSVVLIDHEPAARRAIEIERLAGLADVLVLHDTEPRFRKYGYQGIWPLFAFRRHYTSRQNWATAVSNSMDVTKWDDPWLKETP